MKLRKVPRLLALGMSALALAGTVALAAPAATSGAQSKVTIQYWTNDTNPVEKQIVAAFNASHPDINVQLTAYQTDTYLTSLATAASNRSLPDVFFEGLGDTLAHEYEDAGLIENLTPFAKQLGWASQFSKISVKLLTYKDQWWEEPLYTIALGVFYRKDIFAKLHLTPPTTFAAFVSDMATIKAAGYTPMSLGGQDYWLPMRVFDALLEYYGKNSFFTQLAERKISWDSKPVIEAFNTMHEWTNEDYFTPGFLSINPSDDYIPFFQGHDAMVFEGSFEDATILGNHQNPADYGFFAFPQNETPNLLSVFAQGMMIAKNTTHLQAALTFMEYYASAANLKRFAADLTQPFARLGVAPPADQPQSLEISKLIVQDGGGYLPIDQILPQQLVNAFSKAQAADITGGETPAQAAASLASAVKSYTGPWPWGSQPVP